MEGSVDSEPFHVLNQGRTAVRRFVALLQGDSPSVARPVVATEDEALVSAFVDALARRLGATTGRHDALRLDREVGREDQTKTPPEPNS